MQFDDYFNHSVDQKTPKITISFDKNVFEESK